jgi:small subunit ribosomal protein S17
VSETSQSKVRPIRVVVTSDKMSKSRVGMFERLVKHARYGKHIKRRTKFMFHDEQNLSKAGDEVLITPSRPLSRRKKYALLSVEKKAAE